MRHSGAAAPVAELVDALDSKSSSARSAGSIPARGTNSWLAAVLASHSGDDEPAAVSRHALSSAGAVRRSHHHRPQQRTDHIREEPAAERTANRGSEEMIGAFAACQMHDDLAIRPAEGKPGIAFVGHAAPAVEIGRYGEQRDPDSIDLGDIRAAPAIAKAEGTVASCRMILNALHIAAQVMQPR